MKKLLLPALLLLTGLPSYAQSLRTIGNVRAVNIGNGQVTIEVNNANVLVQVYTPNIIRLRIDKKELGKDFSYAVIAQPVQTSTRISQNEKEILVATDSLQLRINKTPFAVTFLTPDGKVINEDEKGLTSSWSGDAVTTYKKMQEGERFIGLGEKVGNFDRRGNAFTNWNSDVFGYSTGQDPLYSTIPFYVGIHHGMNYGIFFDNTWRSDFNFGASNNRFSSFGAAGGEMNYYFIYHTRLADIIQSYTHLTGRMPLPPLWSLGYQQNRYSYYPDSEVIRIAQTLREKKIPADGITLDIHYMDAYKIFTWNKDRFPNPKQTTDALKKLGFKTTVIMDPGIKVEKGYSSYESGLQQNIFIKYPDGQPYTGQVWPGWCHFPDFTSEKGRTWWKKEMKAYFSSGVEGFWNDMNEIATWGQKMPDNVLFAHEGDTIAHPQAHNAYGLQMTKASYEGAREAMNRRPFVLTRAGYAGLQRYTAIWTGDNRAEDDHMLLGVRLLNSLGISGVAFNGMDVGGFTGNASVGLYTRWVQLGAFMPYFRNHTGVNTRSAEPWSFGEEALEIARNYINLRYRLLPYLYSHFYEATQTAMPIMRSLSIDYTHDPKVYDPRFQNQFMFGHGLLVTPFESQRTYAEVYLPQGKWYSLYTDAVSEGGHEYVYPMMMKHLPVYVKAGSIVPAQSLVQNTTEKPGDTLFLHVYKGEQPNSFLYYEDDGETYDYEKGQFYKRQIKYEGGQLVLEKPEGKRASQFSMLSLVLHGFDQPIPKAKTEKMAWLNAISRFDPQAGDSATDSCTVQRIHLKNENSKIVVGL
ncbi:glycoside hydrolase family 31 protein [Chitinophaga horti]|uniref:Glycoside hydrolase family 31 protein n=1 Tax=Chitinophaga horti TaxID=2920382 RepID=A0ABY6IZR6_9BACT|nr:glycoside hydrolase family 31 protein [Chitinophaga horti]UYQ92671.1 glycoside hydrolase family 31 protein [Chitinophaga horti]